MSAATTTTTLRATPNPVVAGQPITLTAIVTENTLVNPVGVPAKGSDTSGHDGLQAAVIPSGSVTLYDGAVALGTVAVDGNGRATLTTSALGVGAHTLTATYCGDAISSSSKQILAVTVNAAQLASSIPAPALSPLSLLALIGEMFVIGVVTARRRRAA